jgi:hypothetical protein
LARNERLDQLLRADLLLSLQRALVGAVPASLRAVTCDWDETKITLRYIFDGPANPYEVDALLAVGAEVASDFRDTVALDEQIVRVDHPAGLAPHFLRAWAYMRKEEPTEDMRLLLAGAGGDPRG